MTEEGTVARVGGPLKTDADIRARVEEMRRQPGVTSVTMGRDESMEDTMDLARACEAYVRGGVMLADENYQRVQEAHAAVTETPFPLGRVVITSAAFREIADLLGLETSGSLESGQFVLYDSVAMGHWPDRLIEWIEGTLERHRSGDWGDADPEDRATNDRSLREGQRLMSVYRHALSEEAVGPDLWVITEWDRSATTLLLPEDY